MAFTPTGVEFVSKGFSGYMKNLSKADKAQRGLGDSASGIGRKFASLGTGILGFGAVLGKVALGGVLALTAGVVALGTVAVTTAISFESAFTGVTKTIDGLSDAAGNLTTKGKEIRKQFEELSTVVPATFEEIASIGEIGGQLGVGEDAITGFTETVIQLRDTTNLTAEDAATSLARIANIYQVATDDMDENTRRAGSAIVGLGNHFATSESEILNFATRIAGAARVAGLSQADIFGIGAAFSSVGVPAERGGTAVQKVLNSINAAVHTTAEGIVDYSDEIDSNVKQMSRLNAESARLEAQFPGLQDEVLAQRDAFIAGGGSAEDFGRQLGDKTRQKALETALSLRELTSETQELRAQHGQPIDTGQLNKFAEVAGLSADEFREKWETDAAGAFQLFVEGLGRQGDNAVATLEDLGLADERLVGSFLSVAGAGDLMGEAIGESNEAFEEGTALSEEAIKRYNTTKSKLEILKNTFRLLAARIGDKFLPIIKRLVDSATELVKKWAGPIEDAIENTVLPAVDNAIRKIEGIITLFQRFGAGGAAAGILAMLGFGPDTITTVRDMFDAISDVITGFQEGGISGGGGAVGGILAMLGFGPDTITIVRDMFDAISDVITGFQEGGISGGFEALFSSESATNALQGVIDLISQFLADNWPIVQEQLFIWRDQFFGWVQELYPQIPTLLTGVITGITTFLTDNWPTISDKLFEWSTMFWDWAKEAALGAATALAGLGVAMLAWASGGEGQAAMTELGETLAQLLLDTLALSAANTEGTGNVLLTLALGLLAAVGGILGTLIIMGGQLVAGILSGILSSLGLDLQPALFSELGGILTELGTNMLTAAKVVGLDLLLGIIGGIEDTRDQLITTLEQIGTIIVETVKSFLGISSPSTIFFQFGIDIIQGLIDGIGSLLGSLAEIGGQILSSLFGGGEGEEGAAVAPPAIVFDPEALAGFQQLQMVVDAINLALVNIGAVTLITLAGVILEFVAAVLPVWMTVNLTVTMTNQLLMDMYTIHLIALQEATTVTTNLMITGFNAVNAILQVTINLLMQIALKLKEVAKAADEAVKSLEKIGEQNEVFEDMIELLDEATSFADDLATALSNVASAMGGVGGALSGIGFSSGGGFSGGVGFAGGTLGWTVPPGYPNDTFPIRVSSGEELLVAPPSSSIDEIVSDAFGLGQSVMVNVNVGSINNQMDVATLGTFIKRTVSEVIG